MVDGLRVNGSWAMTGDGTARMADVLDVRPGARVLDAGTGCRYHAAVIAQPWRSGPAASASWPVESANVVVHDRFGLRRELTERGPHDGFRAVGPLARSQVVARRSLAVLDPA